MPLGNFSTDSKPKNPLKKATSFLSPLLLVSVSLHGLAMLLPIPEQEKVEAEVVELPEPIQVSELPELDVQVPESRPVPVFAPAPVPEAPAVVQPSAPAQSPTVVVQQPDPVEPSEPQPVESQEIAPKPSEKKPMAEKNPIELESDNSLGSGSKVRVYRKENTTSLSYLEAFSTALEQGVFSDGTPIQYNPIRKGTLTFALLAGDNCFPEASPIDADSVMLPTSLGVVVQNDGDKGFVQSITLVRSTGFEDSDNLIIDAILDDRALFDLVDSWLRTAVGNNGSFPFEPPLNTLAYNIFNVEVVFDEHSCPETGE